MSMKKVYQDRNAICPDCQATFKITAREHMFAETMGYRMPKRCLKCRRSGKSKKNPEKIGTSVREMFEAGEFQRLFEPTSTHDSVLPIQVGTTEVTSTETSTDTPESVTPRTPSENVNHIKNFFALIPIRPDQPEATLEDIKVLMTRANQMRWPDDGNKCRRQGCSMNGHIHPHFTTMNGKSMIWNLYEVESSKALRKPQIEFLYEAFGKVLSGAAFLDRDGLSAVYIATPGGSTEEEVRANVLKYP